MRVEIGFVQTCSAVIVVLATMVAKEVDSRLPPKLLKVASGAGKALYARGYGYSVIPIPQKILLQTNVARREVHHPRPTRRTKRPRRGKRPPAPYAAKYQDYRPSRKRRPPPYNREPDYFEQENDEDFEYQEFEDFVAKHSELYADGYNSRGKPPRNRFKDEDGAFSENSGFVYRRPRPTRSGRPTTKLYSAAIALPSRHQKEESDYDDEEEDDYNRDVYDRGRYREEDEEDDRYYLRDRYRDWNPDDVYHDRTYETKQEKFRRAAEEKPKPQNPRKPQLERFKKPNNIFPERPISPQDNQYKWKTQNERNRFQNPNRMKHLFLQEDQLKWKETEMEPTRLQPTRLDPVRPEAIELGDQGRWRNPESLGIGQFFGKEPKEREEWKEPEIITKQNAGRWEQKGKRNQAEMKENSEGWVKEHSVGYGIEIDGGGRRKKVEQVEPDVVYGQSGYSRPRVPDLGYGQGMELANDKVTGWQVYLR